MLIRDKKVEVMDFNISGVVIRHRPEQERTEADVEVAINAIAVKL